MKRVSRKKSEPVAEVAKVIPVTNVPLTPVKPKRGGCCSVRGEKDSDLQIAFPVEIRAEYEFTAHLPTPGSLLHHLTISEKPVVVLRDGRVIQPTSDCNGGFNDSVARLFAEQNNGIYFPSNIRSPDCWIKFDDFLRAAEIGVQNMLKMDYSSVKELHEQAAKQGGLDELAQESKYFDKVRVWPSNTEIASGLEGNVHARGEKNIQHDTFMGPEGKQYGIMLTLDLSGFGYGHLKMSGRRLMTEFHTYPGINTSETQALFAFIRAQNDNKHEDYHFELHAPNDREGINEVQLEMQSPGFYFGNNQRLERPVMQTKDMLVLYRPVADAIALGIANIHKYHEEQEKAKFQKTYDTMFPPVRVGKLETEGNK